MKKPLKGTGGTLTASDILEEARSVILPPLTREEAIRSKEQAVIGAKEFVERAIAIREKAKIEPNNLVKEAKKRLRDRERELKQLVASK